MSIALAFRLSCQKLSRISSYGFLVGQRTRRRTVHLSKLVTKGGFHSRSNPDLLGNGEAAYMESVMKHANLKELMDHLC